MPWIIHDGYTILAHESYSSYPKAYSIIEKKDDDFAKILLNAHRDTTKENIDCANLLQIILVADCTLHLWALFKIKLKNGAAKQRDKMLSHVWLVQEEDKRHFKQKHRSIGIFSFNIVLIRPAYSIW